MPYDVVAPFWHDVFNLDLLVFLTAKKSTKNIYKTFNLNLTIHSKPKTRLG